ncbi:hypothetical protein D3C73_844610 [compost metagenome]
MAEINTTGQLLANQNAICITCQKYKVTIPKSEIQNMDLYVSYKDCDNQFQSVPYGALETDFDDGTSEYLVLYVCVNLNYKTISFSHKRNGEAIDIGANVEYVENCY